LIISVYIKCCYSFQFILSINVAICDLISGLTLALISTAVTKYRQSKNPHHHGHGDHGGHH